MARRMFEVGHPNEKEFNLCSANKRRQNSGRGDLDVQRDNMQQEKCDFYTSIRGTGAGESMALQNSYFKNII